MLGAKEPLKIPSHVTHPLSYIQATNFQFECGLPYVSKPGYMLGMVGVHNHAIIQKLAHNKVTSVKDFISILSRLPIGA